MRWALCFLLLCASCAWRPQNREYRDFYSYVRALRQCPKEQLPECYVAFYVSARRLDYSSEQGFFRSLHKHPIDGSTNCDVGHAWVCLHTPEETLVAGHSGELGELQPRYFEGVMQLRAIGDANPIRYLWCTQRDGFLQQGSGGHKASFAAFKEVTAEQHAAIRALFFRQKSHWERYCLRENNCVTFAQEVASVLGISLEGKIAVSMPKTFWTDPDYSVLEIATPDALERALVQAASRGELKALSE